MSELKRLREELETAERRRIGAQRLLSVPQEDEHFLWSMVDVVTLLLIFFILLYASAINRTTQDEPRETTVRVQRQQHLAAAADGEARLRSEVRRLVAANEEIGVRWDEARPVFVLGEPVTFDEGQAELIADHAVALGELAEFIARQPGYRVVVAGHTDDVPIHTAQYPSNWELSTARAVSVLKFLAAHGVAPERMSVRGHAEYDPLTGDVAARETNRRVEITLVKSAG